MKVRQTACRYCGQDIENFSPYRKGEWHDRGGNSSCPYPAKGKIHAPVVERHGRVELTVEQVLHLTRKTRSDWQGMSVEGREMLRHQAQDNFAAASYRMDWQ